MQNRSNYLKIYFKKYEVLRHAEDEWRVVHKFEMVPNDGDKRNTNMFQINFVDQIMVDWIDVCCKTSMYDFVSYDKVIHGSLNYIYTIGMSNCFSTLYKL